MIRLRSTLTVKLFRDLWRLRAQAVAIALVTAAGIATVVMAQGLIRSLDATRAAYYDQYRFADIFAPLVRAPEPVIAEVRRLPGVAAADSRISARATLDLPQIGEPVSARVHSLPAPTADALNRLVLRSGRFPEPENPNEVVASEPFVLGAGLRLGDRFRAVLYGKQVELRLVGTVLSPEYIYALAPGQFMPDNRHYGILWMAREPLAAALDRKQAFNEALVRLSPGADSDDVIRRLDLLLAPYGGVGAYSRKQQISDRFISSEIEQLRTMAAVLPPVFLLVAAFLLNIVLARLVETEREIIGLMKAFGFRNRAILLHYAALALLLAFGGFVLGIGLGIWLGRALSQVYQRFYTFPFLAFRAGLDVYLLAAAATLVPVLLGATTAVWRSARLTPAAAMQPPKPADFSSAILGRLTNRLGPDEPSRIILRGLLRRPLRTALTVLGLASALALYVATQNAPASMNRMIELGFGAADRSDLMVTFAEARDARALYELARIPGVIAVQPFRATDARFRAGHYLLREGLVGAEREGDLSRLVDMEGDAVKLPKEGAIISGRMAQALDVGRGDVVEAEVGEGERPVLRLPVVGVLDSPFGATATLDRRALNRLLREGNTLSGAYLEVDPARRRAVEKRLEQSPMVAGISRSAAAERAIRSTIEENLLTMTLFYSGLAGLVVVGVVYNSARISLSEQARDLASLRVLGFRRREVAFVLLGEQAILLLLSLPLGLVGGVEFWRYLAGRFNSDLFTIPVVIDPRVLGQGVIVMAAAGAATAMLIRRRVDRLDLVRALKTRE